VARPGPPEENEVKALADGRRKRLERDRQLSMSERLARVHELSKQLTSIRGAARER